jgi:transcriptional regulator with XRE-family HTH domain
VIAEDTRRHYLPEELSTALREARRARGLGLRQAAVRIGIGPGYLSLLEHAERCPSVAVARAIVRALGLEGDLADELLAVAQPNAGRSFTRPFWATNW